jgi:hypothetical protein
MDPRTSRRELAGVALDAAQSRYARPLEIQGLIEYGGLMS